jgi:hypothetical protein
MEMPPLESLRDVYIRLSKDPERYTDEFKTYALTESNMVANSSKLVDTIASIANHGKQFGFVICAHSGIALEDIVDGAKLDDLINKTIHPRILVTLARHEIDGNTVDFIIIPKSASRPHIKRGADGRYYIPFRGIANNSTAARAELDQIYRDQFIGLIREAIPGVSIGATDNLGKYLDSIGYGAGPSKEPELTFVVAPLTVPQRVIQKNDLLSPEALRTTITHLTTSTINYRPNHQQWFSMYQGFSPVAREDYAEILQVSVPPEGQVGEYLWSARIYETGVVTYCTILYPTQFPPGGSFPIEWFADMASATLTFAQLAFERFDPEIDELAIRALISKAENVGLSKRGILEMRSAGTLLVPRPNILIPSRDPIRSTKLTLKSDIASIVGELRRILESYYTFSNR